MTANHSPAAGQPRPHAAMDEAQLRAGLLAHFESQPIVGEPGLAVLGLRPGDQQLLRSADGSTEASVLAFHLPDDFGAIGVIAESVTSTPPSRDHREATLLLGVSRTGASVSMVVHDDQGVIDTTNPSGWLIDACRRAVGLTTAPCNSPSLDLPIAIWLDRLMITIVGAPTALPLRWSDAVDLCPVPARWRSHDPIDLGITLGSTARSWPALRAAVIGGAPSVVGLTPEQAAWMDDAMFARWCLGAFPDLANLRADVEFLAPADIAENIELALRAAWRAFSNG